MLKPLNENVVIEPIEVEKKTASGILLSGDAAQPKHAEGTVIAVGPGKLSKTGERRALSVKVGDRVIYGGYSQSTVEHEGKDLVVLPEKDILAIVE
ncbi:MAG: co-chaperone GroES [Defluviitaleaceae bacterium]|nr:co-chaperone GroES [Defluviitaleaceae bacterium]